MKLFSIATAFLAAASVSASTLSERHKGRCLKQWQAERIVGQFIQILQHTDVPAANVTAQALLADNFSEISDSILSLEGRPLGPASSLGTKEEYINGLLSAPGVGNIVTYEIFVAGCSKIIWYWLFTDIGSAQYPVQGFNLFTINNSLQIERLNLEFNSIAWALNTGYQIIFPPPRPE